jgi:eukaryotic-like serine/threonine-protein kinase
MNFLQPGQTLKHYRVINKIGEGGMGEVYLAHDTTELDRLVALKILPIEVAANKDRLQRFTQEARTVSNLNHPNILTIYEFGQAGSVCFIATEFIDGETLRQYLSARRLKLGEVLDIGAQIVAALNAAHEAGVVHRDIKPENVMVRRDHIMKVLDFGLAKLGRQSASSAVDSEAGTKVFVHTQPGRVLGTVSYMSPEQSVGSSVDHRTDIWSAGVLLYEMLAGVVPFAGKDIHRQIIAIQEQQPAPLSHHVEGVPARLEEIVVKCLAKDRDERYQTAKDLLIDLRNLKRRLDVDTEIERTVPPEKSGLSTSGGHLRGAPTSPPVGDTPNTRASSAEFIVSGIKQHKIAIAVIAGLVLIVAGGIIAVSVYLRARKTEVAIESVAVLPFVNQNHDADSEYLSDGLTESIINSLTQLPNLKVIARSSVFRYKGKETDPLAAGKELGVRAVLTGRIMQRGDDLTISAELVDVGENKQLWGEQYSAKVSDLLTVQRQIASQITSNLRLKLSGAEQGRINKHYTDNPEAYQLYLKGVYFSNKRTEEGLRKGIDYFNQAISVDPNYALAYSGLADSYALLGNFYFIPTKEGFAKAKTAAMKAVELDDTLAEAHTSLAGSKLFYDWDWSGYETEARRAMDLNPNYRPLQYAQYLAAMKRFDEAIKEAKRAEEIDPLSTLAVSNVAWMSYFARNYDQAREQYQKAIEIEPTHFLPHRRLGLIYLQTNLPKEALAEIEKAAALSGAGVEARAYLGYAYAFAGKRTEAQKIIDELREESKTKYVAPYPMALIYTGLGDKDQALQWLDKAYEARASNMVFLTVEPIFDPLRSDPRFADLIRRIGLPQ